MNAKFLQMHQIVSIISNLNASLESCPISWCHWAVEVLTGLCLFWTLSSCQLCHYRDQTPQPQPSPHPPTIYIFLDGCPFQLCWRTKSVCVSLTSISDLYIELQSSPKVHLEYLLFYISPFLKMCFYVIPDCPPLKIVYISASLKLFCIYCTPCYQKK